MSPPHLAQPVATGADPPANRGAPGRVAAVHDQARRGPGVTAGFTLAAIASMAIRSRTGWWLALHLFAIGGLLGAISAAAPVLRALVAANVAAVGALSGRIRTMTTALVVWSVDAAVRAVRLTSTGRSADV